MKFLPGVRFVPDDELIVRYLREKITNPQYNSCQFIKDVNVNEYDPETITDLYQSNGNNEWYFFNVREASSNRQGAKRRAGNGYWRASVANKAVSYDGGIVGYRKGLEYWRGNPSKGEKTSWLMHEYTIGIASEASLQQHGLNNIGNTQVDTWSVCKIYKTKRKSNKRKSEDYDVGELKAAAKDYNDQENGAISVLESLDMFEIEELLNDENEVVSRSERWDVLELETRWNEENETVSRLESWGSESSDMQELEELLNEIN